MNEPPKITGFKDLMKARAEKEKAETVKLKPEIEPETPLEKEAEKPEKLVNQWLTKQPENGEFLVNQLTSSVNQSEKVLVNQLNDLTVNQSDKNEDEKTNVESTYRSRKDRKLKGLRLPLQKLHKWETWCYLHKVDFQDAVEIALDWLTSENKTGQLDNHILIDDFDDKKLDDELIIFYKKWSGNKIKLKDQMARESVKKFSAEICKIGILTAIARAKNKINSFAYCVPVIEEIAEQIKTSELDLQKSPDYLKYLEIFVQNKRDAAQKT